MSQQLLSIVAVGLCAPIVVSAPADIINWVSTQDGFWDYPANWLPQQRPGANDDAKHKTRLSAITIRYDEFCKSFEGSGTGAGDRFLLIQSGKRWTVGQNLYETDGGSETLNFAVKFQDGGNGDLTELFVSGNVTGIDLVPDGRNAEHVGRAAPRGPPYGYRHMP